MSEASRKDLHDFLRFNGKIFVSTVMPDERIDRLEISDIDVTEDEVLVGLATSKS
ncbi:MAG: hypothetical protein QW542_02155 [Thermoproteota archaeon]